MRSGEAQSTISLGGTYRERPPAGSVTKLDDEFMETNVAQVELNERRTNSTGGLDVGGGGMGGGGGGDPGRPNPALSPHHRASAENIMKGMGFDVAESGGSDEVDLSVVSTSGAESVQL